ncbi:hypothetical protein F7734_21755 [Scytonema sp. UIC 10036]|uniref:hypothetical protein n=1 Tax=Scytonema sp. UIC 10036 TaxID=2304196 RepID=UPI0012DA97A6|nr:hypothetical protein [Scytonema sp. UIC 10036]MUG94843.1 hypothetical protein [Scytonema sp. UIC 10036]
MTFNPEKRSQELIEIIEQQLQKIDELLSSTKNEFGIEQSANNLKISELKVNCDRDLSVIVVARTDELVKNDLDLLRTRVEFKRVQAKAMFTQNQIRFAKSQVKFASRQGRSTDSLFLC